MFDIVGKRYWYFLISALIIVPGLAAMAISTVQYGSPFRLGVDFTGGSIVELRFEQPVPPEEVRQVFLEHGYTDTSVVADRDLTQALLLARSKPLEDMELSGRFSGTEWGPEEHPDAGRLLEGCLDVRYRVLDALSFTVGGAFDLGDGGIAGDGHRAVAGLRATYRVVDDRLEIDNAVRETILVFAPQAAD